MVHMASDLFFKLHEGLPRQGPGSAESTRTAYQAIQNIDPNPTILDIGCGPGAQTLELASISGGKVTGLDIYKPFLDDLKTKALSQNLDQNINIVLGDMYELHFEPETFDIIWSEGAIYIIGFEQGLRNWRYYLKPNGYLAVTELSWLKADPPNEPVEYWSNNYQGMSSIEENVKSLQNCGYELVKHFILPSNDWWNEYYTPLAIKIGEFRNSYADDDKALFSLDEEDKEIDMFKKYSDWYGYVFYIMQKKN
jgi:ubiquinone/menaquinone biosynthesis C-methylase UbiE